MIYIFRKLKSSKFGYLGTWPQDELDSSYNSWEPYFDAGYKFAQQVAEP
jgi:hypothetical protein